MNGEGEKSRLLPTERMNSKTSSILVGILFMVFGWSSWIDINGLWVELPVLVNRLPEGWFLPTYFVVIIQLANIGPLVYGLSYRFTNFKKSTLETGFIYTIVLIGALSVFLLAFVWDSTSLIDGKQHSTALLILTFFLALVDCTSSVTFIPFMHQFKSHHMTAYFVGEGLSGLLPTGLAFIQGSGEYTCSYNSSVVNGTNVTTVVPQYKPLIFSVQLFFLILFAMLTLSLISFTILKFSSFGKDQRKNVSYSVSNEDKKGSTDSSEKTGEYGIPNIDSTAQFLEPDESLNRGRRMELIYLLVIIAISNGLANGALPSVQTFSLLPYGHVYYSLGVKLSALANPIACLLTFVVVAKKKSHISVLMFICLFCASYILAISHYSPHLPHNNVASAVIMVIIWVVFTGVVSYIKVVISSKLLPDGHSTLFLFGVAQQIGSLVGALLSFICVNYYPKLTPAPPCAI